MPSLLGILHQTLGQKTILRIASDTDVLAPIGFGEQGRKEVFLAMSGMDQLVVQAEFQKESFMNRHGFEPIVIDMILNEAVLPSVPRSTKAPVTSNDVNIGSMLKLLSSAQQTSGPVEMRCYVIR